MAASASRVYSADSVKPVIRPDLAVRSNGRLTVSKSYVKGELLGEIIGTNELQSITIDATGGTFTVTFGGQTTSALAWNDTAANVQAALIALSSIGAGNVSVTKPASNWVLTVPGSTNGGNFTVRVTINGVVARTASQAWNVATATLQTAIQGLANVGSGNATVSGTAGTTYNLFFAGALGNVDVEIENDSTNVGGTQGIGVSTAPASITGPFMVTFQGTLGATNVAQVTTGAGSLTGGAATATPATVTAGAAGTGVYDKYSAASVVGLAVPVAILEYACTTDSAGNITRGDNTIQEDHGITSPTAPVYLGGYFRTSDVPSLTPALLTALGGKMVVGGFAANTSTGIFKF